MKTAPDVDMTALQRDLAAGYGIHAVNITFLPHGECSWGYRIDTAGGEAYFLKLFRNSSLPAWAAQLVYRLHVVCHIRQVSYPLPARSGDVLNTLGGLQAAVFPFINGQSLFDLSSRRETLYQLGRLLAQLHSCHELDLQCPRVEQFDAWGLESYHRVLEACSSLQALPGAAGDAQRLLRPLSGRLENLLENLLLFQQKARQCTFKHCICHGDPTPGNILVAPGGEPYLIDWDDVILAPRERDLVFWEQDDVFFENVPSSPVLDGYRSITGSFELDPDIIGFYQRQWTVGEIAAYGHRLLFERQDEQQNQSDLANLEEELRWLWN